VCVSSAISANHTPTFTQIFGEQLVTLQEGGLVKCERCGILMAAHPEAHLCQLCEYRRIHPFGSMPLPGIKDLKPPVAAQKLE
jgi:ribosomal protein S27AE